MTRLEADRIVWEIKECVRDCIGDTPLRRKGDSMYVQGLKDMTGLVEQIMKEHINEDKT